MKPGNQPGILPGMVPIPAGERALLTDKRCYFFIKASSVFGRGLYILGAEHLMEVCSWQ